MPAFPLRRADWPGLVVAMLVAAVAVTVPAALERAPAPLARLPLSPVLVAILLGIALAGVAQRRPAWSAGLRLATEPLLKFAVMLIGLRLSLGQLGTLGVHALPLVLAALVTGLGLAWALGRVLGIGPRLTALLAVGTAICGVSAIAATAPAIRARPEETAYALACVAVFGLLATVVYPWWLAGWLPDGHWVGLVLGVSIHDTAQVAAAALLHEQVHGDPATLAAATVAKLLRNMAMLAVIPAAAWWATRGGEGGAARPAFPVFILGFLGFAGLRTAGDAVLGASPAWLGLLDLAGTASAFLFSMAMAAIGMGLRLAALRALGPRPALVALLTALGMGAVALLLARALI